MATTLQVEPQQLAELAKSLAELVNQTKSRVPTERVEPAGGDDISRAAAARIDKQGAQLANLIIEGLINLYRGGYAIGGAAELYSSAEPEAAEAIARAYGGRGATVGSIVRNPVAGDVGITRRDVPSGSTAIPGGDVDPQTFAQALEIGGGDNGQSARTFVSVFMTYAQDPHAQAATKVDETQARLQDWQPIGTKVATVFKQFRAWLDSVENHVSTVVQRAMDYDFAHEQVRTNHPSLATIREAKLRVQTATTTEERVAALRNLEIIMNRGRQAQQQYRTAIESGVPGEDANSGVDPPPDIAAATNQAVNGPAPIRRGTNGTPSAKNQTGAGEKQQDANDGLNNLLNNLGQQLANNQAADTGQTPAADQTAAQTPSSAGQSNANNPQIPDLSQLANQDPNATSDDGFLDDPLLDEPLDDYALNPGGYGGGLGGGGVGGVPTSLVGGAPLAGTSASSAPKLADARQFGVLPAGGRSQAGVGGMPMYPPHMGGMGGANANGGDRKNPYAVEAKIVDDDELRSQVLASATVNEKPAVLPPEATQPTADRTSAKNEAGATA